MLGCVIGFHGSGDQESSWRSVPLRSQRTFRHTHTGRVTSSEIRLLTSLSDAASLTCRHGSWSSRQTHVAESRKAFIHAGRVSPQWAASEVPTQGAFRWRRSSRCVIAFYVQ